MEYQAIQTAELGSTSDLSEPPVGVEVITGSAVMDDPEYAAFRDAYLGEALSEDDLSEEDIDRVEQQFLGFGPESRLI